MTQPWKKVAEVLPRAARAKLLEATLIAKPTDRYRAIEQVTEGIKQEYPQFFRQEQ